MKIVTQTAEKAWILSDLKRSPPEQKNEAGWIKKIVERKNYIETVQFYAKLSTNGLIFRA